MDALIHAWRLENTVSIDTLASIGAIYRMNTSHPSSISCQTVKQAVQEIVRRYFRMYPCSDGSFGNRITRIIVCNNNNVKEIEESIHWQLNQLIEETCQLNSCLNEKEVKDAVSEHIEIGERVIRRQCAMIRDRNGKISSDPAVQALYAVFGDDIFTF